VAFKKQKDEHRGRKKEREREANHKRLLTLYIKNKLRVDGEGDGLNG